jgi:hypothetical protein
VDLRRRDGSETALCEDKAAIRGAGPSTGPVFRSGTSQMIRAEHAAWITACELVRTVVRAAARLAAPARKGPNWNYTLPPIADSCNLLFLLTVECQFVSGSRRPSGRCTQDHLTHRAAGGAGWLLPTWGSAGICMVRQWTVPPALAAMRASIPMISWSGITC